MSDFSIQIVRKEKTKKRLRHGVVWKREDFNGTLVVAEYLLYVGKTSGDYELFNQSQSLNHSVTVSSLPTDGSTVYVRLLSRFGVTWQYYDYSFTASKVVQGTVASPTLNPAEGNFDNSVTVKASTITAGAIIRYTINNTDPNSTSTVFPAPGLLISSTKTLRAKAFKTGMADSAITSGTYTKNASVPPVPTHVSPVNDGTATGTEVTLNWNASAGATKYITQISQNATFSNQYTGSEDTSTSMRWTGLPNDGSTWYWRVKAGNASGWSSYSSPWSFMNGSVQSVAAPTFNPAQGNFDASVTVKASTLTAGATIRYTINNTDPNSTSTVFPAPGLLISSTKTLRAKAFKTGMANSAVATAVYTKVAAPKDDPKGLTWNYSSQRWDSFVANATLWITSDPFMPRISIQNVVTGGIKLPKQTYWKFETVHIAPPPQYTDWRAIDDRNFPVTGFSTVPYAQAWEVSKGFNGDFFGGDGTFTFYDDLTMPQRRFTCKIRGKNPSSATAWKFASSLGALPYFRAMLQHESSFSQFDANGGAPLFGYPNGWGVAQIDRGSKNCTTMEVWNWKANITSALAILKAKHGYTIGYFALIKKLNPNEWEEPPAKFNVPGTTVILNAIDASDITLYNGGSDVLQIYPYCWKFLPTNPSGKRWEYMKNSQNYLYKVALVIQAGG